MALPHRYEATPFLIVLIKRKIAVFELRKIHGFGLERNPLAWIIAESAAAAVFALKTTLAANDGSFIGFCSKLTVGAGTLYFFTKQHL